MKVINGQDKPAQTPEQRQRNGLLAMVHIAKKDLGLNSGEYGAILKGFKVESAAKLSIPQLERLVKYLKHLGWKPLKGRRKTRPDSDIERLAALRHRVMDEAKHLDNWEQRLPGLTKSICGVVTVNWVHSAAKLERLLVVIGNIRKAARMEVSARGGGNNGNF